jgi:phosphate acetyltransferase
MTEATDHLLARCSRISPVTTAVVHPVTAIAMEAAADATARGLIDPVLIGPRRRIEDAIDQAALAGTQWNIIDTEHSHEAAAHAAMLAGTGKVGAIMKGSLHSDELLGAILKPEAGLRTERRLSHAYVMSIASYPKPFIITDAAVNIAPDLSAKADIVQSAVNLWRVLFGGEEMPKVAVLAAVETVNPRMQATLDAAALCKMADRGQITGCVIDGPLAFDNAVSSEAAREKGIVSSVAGNADILLVPDIEAGNMLAKQLSFLGGAEAAGIVLGARVPVILTSRADSERARQLSCAIAALMAQARASGEVL